MQIEIQLLKNGRKSDTSSTPSSQDYSRSNKFKLRDKSTRKSGGQIGHKGSSLKMSKNPDKTQKYMPVYCKQCGEKFHEDTVFELRKRKQEVVIPPVKAGYIEHQSYSCTCSKCNTQTTTGLPLHLKANIIYNIVASMSNKATPVYNTIKEKIATSKVVGGDKSGVKIDGDKAWFWVFQNSLHTFIKVAYSRGFKSITETFSNGFPMSTYISDSLPAQLKVNTKAKQLCLAHLMRELKNFENA